MRVLLVHHGYPPEGQGGSEFYTRALARRLARDHEVTVLHRSADPGRPDHDLRSANREGVRVISLNNLHRVVPGFEAYRDPIAAASAGRVLEEVRPDIVHAGHLSGLSTGLVFEARRRGAPVAITLHDFWPVCPLGQLLTLRLDVCPGPEPRRCLGCVGAQVAPVPARGVRPLSRLPLAPLVARLAASVGPAGASRIARRLAEMREVLRAADLLIAPSRFVRDRLAGLGIGGIEVLENGHEPVALPPRVPDPVGRVRFGFVGSVIPSKGAHVLAEAFRGLDDRRAALRIHGPFPPYHGDTGYEARLRAILGPHADESIRGPFDHGRLGEVLAGVDVLVVPSLWEENSPLTVQEALLARLPIVPSDHGGLAEKVREGVDGLRFRAGDATALARVLRRLLDEPGLRARLGSNPPSVPDMDTHVAALASLYEAARRRLGRRAGRVGAVVVDHGRPDDTRRAVDSVRDPDLGPRIVVVESGFGGASPQAAASASGGTEVEVVRLPENLGYAAGLNAGVARLRAHGCDRFLFLNNDAVLEPGSLRRLAEALDDRRLGAVGPVVLRGAEARLESRGLCIDLRWGRQRLLGHGEPDRPSEGRLDVPSLSGAALMVSGAALDRVGPLDEMYFHSFEETDWCVRARREGFALAVVLGARARHAGGRSLGASSPEKLYYAVRNHLRAAERLLPLGPAAGLARRCSIVALNVAHVLRQGQVPRLAGLNAVLRGVSDFRRGRFGPQRGAA